MYRAVKTANQTSNGYNMEKRNNTELLAPAGNPAAFYGAVHAGADAVYLAGNRFGARAYAENFSTEELVECIRYGHLLGRKIYLTVNTLMKEQELRELYDYLLPFYEAGLDAVIVQDFGAFRCIRERFPGLELHASTQMTLCGSYGAQLLKNMGASRIVPARELSLRELKEIKDKVDIELETFIHGAMCYCYSGQCLFSSILGGRSGNRGRCAQPCRLPYSVKTEGKKSRDAYYLSLKDMCTIDHLPELISAGIDSFKIEGRMKKPEYAAGVTSIYRKYIDSYYELRERYGQAEAEERFQVGRQDSRHLSSLYIRSEVQDGYYFRHNGREMVTLSSPAYSGSDEMLLEDIRKRYLSEKQRLPVSMEAVFLEGMSAELTLCSGDFSVSVKGERVEAASRQPITEENLRRQLGKLGDSAFFAEKMNITLGSNTFYPLKQVNELRRLAVQRLEEAVLAEKGYVELRKAEPSEVPGDHLQSPVKREAPEQTGASIQAEPPYRLKAVTPLRESAPEKTGFSVSLEREEQLTELISWMKKHPQNRPVLVYVSGDLAAAEDKDILSACRELGTMCPVFLTLPYILRETDQPYLERLASMTGEKGPFSGFLIRSADGLGFLRSREKNCLWHLDANVYIWNEKAAEQLGEGVSGFCLPLELKAAEQRELLKKGRSFEKIVYGRIPMMITANCVLRTSQGCGKDDPVRTTALTDRYGKEFPVVCNCRHCTNIIYNSVPLSLHRELSKWKDTVRLRLAFTLEGPEETGRILDAFLAGGEPAFSEYTTGHEKRGVE